MFTPQNKLILSEADKPNLSELDYPISELTKPSSDATKPIAEATKLSSEVTKSSSEVERLDPKPLVRPAVITRRPPRDFNQIGSNLKHRLARCGAWLRRWSAFS
jgi:hypothetical protein